MTFWCMAVVQQRKNTREIMTQICSAFYNKHETKFNKRRLRLCLPEVTYMGHRLTKDGLSPDPLKNKAIQDMP